MLIMAPLAFVAVGEPVALTTGLWTLICPR
jgi:hypothetical protein